MIAGFRKSLRSWAMLLVLFIALVAIVVTGFGTGGVGGLGSLGGGANPAETVATVEGKAIPASDVTDLVTRQYAAMRQQQPTLEMSEFLAQGAFEQILNQMITSEALMRFADARGLVVSDRMIDRMIVNIPDFRNFTGEFDQATFQQALQSQNLTEARFRADLARQIRQRQLLAPIALGARVPQALANAYANLLLERRRGTIGMISAQSLAAGIEPADAEIAAFYRANRGAFTMPERRVIRYALIGLEQTGAAGAATEEEIARVYRANSALFGARETRTLQQVILQTEREAQAFAQRVRAGTSFADAASQAGFSAEDITFADQSREQFAGETTAEVAAAAFAAAQGSVAGPIRTARGFHVIRVERVNSIPARSLEEARPQIVAFIERRKRSEALNELLGRIQDQLADGAGFDQVAREARLNAVTTPAITADGRPAGGGAWQPAPELQAMLGSAFAMDAEELEPLIEQLPGDDRFALLHVERVDPAAPPPLAQIRDRVRAALVQRRALERAREIADGIARRINAGTPAAQAFAAAPVRPATQQIDMRRLEISSAQGQPPQALLLLFSLQEDRARAVPAADRSGWLVVHHDERTPGDARSDPRALPETIRSLAGTASEEIAQQFARAVELRSEITRDEEAIRRARLSVGGGVSE